MSKAKITLFGIYEYLEKIHEKSPKEPTLFDNLALPEGIDRDTFIYNTLDRGGEFEVIYGDAQILHEKVKFWSSKWYRTFDRWVKALSIDYEPLYNYDRTEEETKTPDLVDTKADNLTDTKISNLKDKRTSDMSVIDTPATTRTLNGSRTEEKTVSAFDASGYQPSEKLTVTDNGHTESLTGTDTEKTTGTDTVDHTGTESISHTGTNTYRHSGKEDRILRAYGNIGVTTSQQMLEAELTISEWNLYDHLSDVFIREFCIPVYV